MTDEAWKLTLRLSANTNISAQDIIHFASAWNAQCFVFITSDDHFYKCIKKILDENPEVNMDVRKPADLLKELFDKK